MRTAAVRIEIIDGTPWSRCANRHALDCLAGTLPGRRHAGPQVTLRKPQYTFSARFIC